MKNTLTTTPVKNIERANEVRMMRLIVVEDDAAHLAAIQRAFVGTRSPVEIRHAGTLHDYRQLIAEYTPDLALMDLNLPDGKATDALISPAEAGKYPVVVMTSFGSESIAVEAMKAGALDYVVKSNETFAEMPRIVSRALREWDLMRARSEAVNALRESEEHYRRITETITDYIYTVELLNGQVVRTTHGPGCIGVTGYTAEEFAADPWLWRRMVREEDAARVLEQASRILTERKVSTIDHRMICKNGSECWVRSTLIPHLGPGGAFDSYDGIIQDISEHKKLETQLLQAQKMEAVGVLAGGIAHDFNNILTAIMGYGEVALMQMQLEDPHRRNIQSMLDGADRAASLTQSLLAFSRKQKIDRKPVNLNNIVKKVEKFLLRIIGEDIAIRMTLHEDVLNIFADAGQMEQVFMNLATNARDAMPRGGSFLIETTVVDLDNEFTELHGFGAPGTYAMIVAADTGMGMDEEIRKKIFDPFFTTKEVGKGTGLGLAMVYGIVKQHEGFITVYSEPGKGTSFRIYLPLINVTAVEASPQIVLEYPKGGTETILLAEDDENLRKLTIIVLEQMGYTVITARDGEEAVKIYLDNKDRIDLLLFDVVMPLMSGKEACEEIRRINPALPVLFISGYSEDFLQQKGLITEGADIFCKPSAPQKLLKKVRELLDQSS